MNNQISLILLVVSILLLILEIFTVSTFFLWIAIGVLFSSFVALFTNNLLILLICGSVVSVISIYLFRSKYISRIKKGNVKTSYEEQIGEKGEVVVAFKGNSTEIGRVKVGGLDWSAISSEEVDFAKGDIVVIKEIV